MLNSNRVPHDGELQTAVQVYCTLTLLDVVGFYGGVHSRL